MKKTIGEIKAFYEGARKTLYDYAWWKDGIEYDGCGIRTLKQILEEINEREQNELKQSSSLIRMSNDKFHIIEEDGHSVCGKIIVRDYISLEELQNIKNICQNCFTLYNTRSK